MRVDDALWVRLLRRMYRDTRRRGENLIFFVLNEVCDARGTAMH